MKAIISLVFASCIALASGCEKDASSGLPDCLRTKLTLGGHDCVTKVEEYMFRGQKAYRQVIGGGCADVPTEVVDEKCQLICSCCGITGIPTGPSEEFSQQATFVKVVWER